jgi:hypothetical protein
MDFDFYYGDPVAFQMYGYGGFGYDTSHVPPDQQHSELYHASKEGDLKKVKEIVRLCTGKTEEEKRCMINKARRWTEVDYKMSGFTKEYEWYDSTPLAIAANQGHSEVVQYLLEQLADPTLKGCPSDNVYLDALGEAKRGLEHLERALDRVKHLKEGASLYGLEDFYLLENETVTQRALKVLTHKSQYLACISMLDAVKPFWQKVPYSSAHYGGDDRRRAQYNNLPTDKKAMLEALAKIDAEGVQVSQEEIYHVTRQIETLQSKFREQERAEEEKRQRQAATRKSKPCWYHAQGTCRFGANCRFSHEL